MSCTVVTTICKGGAAIGAWHKENPEPEAGTLIGVEWTTPDAGDHRSLEQRTRDDIADMLRRHGQPIPDDLT